MVVLIEVECLVTQKEMQRVKGTGQGDPIEDQEAS